MAEGRRNDTNGAQNPATPHLSAPELNSIKIPPLCRFAEQLGHHVVQGLLLRMPLRAGKDIAALMPVAAKLGRSQRFFGMETAQNLGRHQADAGVPMAPLRLVHGADAAVDAATTLGFPVALKGWAATLLHKTDLGLVRLGLADDSMYVCPCVSAPARAACSA